MGPTAAARSDGLAELRRSGAVTELLILYECLTTEPTQLRPIARELGLTVQAVSHSYRLLARRGLAKVRDGRYRPTVAGIAWLHESLGRLGDDVRGRLERLHVIRSCRAVALSDLNAGDAVSLELRQGLLSARRGDVGPSRGRAQTSARRGALVEVAELEGIVPHHRAMLTAARAIELAPFAVGPSNLSNLEDVCASAPTTPTWVLVDPPIAPRDFTDGRATELVRALLERGAHPARTVDEVLLGLGDLARSTAPPATADPRPGAERSDVERRRVVPGELGEEARQVGLEQ